MAKPGRNDPCPCGSGKKYKKCCLTNDEAEKGAEIAAARCLDAHDLKEAVSNRLVWHDEDDEITEASHAVVELVHVGKLNEAEVAARDLLMRYPDEPDGWDCLGIVHENRGENRQAADCYRKMRDIMRQRPDDYDQSFETKFAELINRLDPPNTP